MKVIDIYEKIAIWLNEVLTQNIPEEVVAFCFNLYEEEDYNWSMELVGTDRFDPDDSDWPCFEITDFGTRKALFSWNKEAEWDQVLEEIVSDLKNYLENGEKSDILKSKEAVGVGFVDGDLEIIFNRNI